MGQCASLVPSETLDLPELPEPPSSNNFSAAQEHSAIKHEAKKEALDGQNCWQFYRTRREERERELEENLKRVEDQGRQKAAMIDAQRRESVERVYTRPEDA